MAFNFPDAPGINHKREFLPSDKHQRSAHPLKGGDIHFIATSLLHSAAGFHVSRSRRVPSCVQTRCVVVDISSLSVSLEPCRGEKKKKQAVPVFVALMRICAWSGPSLFILSSTSVAECNFDLSSDHRRNFCFLPELLPPTFINQSYSLVPPQCPVPLLLTDVFDIELEPQSVLLLQYCTAPFKTETTQLQHLNGRTAMNSELPIEGTIY